jgi:hypothetical protein
MEEATSSRSLTQSHLRCGRHGRGDRRRGEETGFQELERFKRLRNVDCVTQRANYQQKAATSKTGQKVKDLDEKMAAFEQIRSVRMPAPAALFVVGSKRLFFGRQESNHEADSDYAQAAPSSRPMGPLVGR